MTNKKSQNKSPYLSIIIPLYNEENRIKNLSKIYRYLDTLGFGYDVTLVNDGSSDKTLEKLNELSKQFDFNLISFSRNSGKGFAVKNGMLNAKGKYLLFTDIDLSTPINELNKFLPYLNEGKIIIGSRKTRGSVLQKRQSLIRENLGKGFTFLSRLVLNLQISDFTCGFKCFPRKAAKDIFSKQTIGRWSFDSEILFLAKKFGYEIKEIPVKWSDDPRTKVKFPQDILSSLLDLYRIRYNWFKKIYEN